MNERVCETCNAALVRRQHACGKPESNRDFVRRRFCSLPCANSRKRGGDSKNAHLYHARKHLAAACEACGSSVDLQVHHVDRNWRNNEASNLQTLCVFCHHFWHAAHERVGRTMRDRMPRIFTL